MADFVTGYHEFAPHERAYALPYYEQHYAANPDTMFHSTGDLDHYLSGYVQHSQQTEGTLFTNMIDFALANMSIGIQTIHEAEYPHATHEGQAALGFFDDAIRALRLSRSLQQSGHATAGFLKEIETEMTLYKNDLLAGGSELDHTLADYLGIALQEVNVARYIEESHGVDHHATVHGYYANEGDAWQASNQMQVSDEDAAPAPPTPEVSEPSPSSEDSLVINIEGPVIIAGDNKSEIAELIRKAFPSPMPAPAPREDPQLLAMVGLPAGSTSSSYSQNPFGDPGAVSPLSSSEYQIWSDNPLAYHSGMPMISAPPKVKSTPQERAKQLREYAEKIGKGAEKVDRYAGRVAVGAHVGLLTPAAPVAALIIGKAMIVKTGAKTVKGACNVAQAYARWKGVRADSKYEGLEDLQSMLGTINFSTEEMMKKLGENTEIPGTGVKLDEIAETAKWLQMGVASGRLSYQWLAKTLGWGDPNPETCAVQQMTDLTDATGTEGLMARYMSGETGYGQKVMDDWSQQGAQWVQSQIGF